MTLEIVPLSGALGAELHGLDLSAPLGNADTAALREALLEHVVIVVRGQDLSPAAQIRLTEVFGPPMQHPLRARQTVEGHPEVMILENRPGRPGAPNDYWHSDISHAQTPPSVSILHALDVPAGRGDTMFCNMYAAYETLSEGMREMLADLRALHSGEATVRRNAGHNDGLPVEELPPPVAHPVVRTHPDTGRRALYVNPHFTIQLADMTREESAPILEPLYAHATRPENVYRHRWAKGDVVMWDNRCAMHYAVRDYDESMHRLMHRTTASGDRPV